MGTTQIVGLSTSIVNRSNPGIGTTALVHIGAATTLGGITWSLTIPLFQPTKRATKIRQSKKKRRPKSNRKCWCPKS